MIMKNIILLMVSFVSLNSFAQEDSVSILLKGIICKTIDLKYPNKIHVENKNRPAWFECRQSGKFSAVSDYYTVVMSSKNNSLLSCSARVNDNTPSKTPVAAVNCKQVYKK